MNMKKPAQLGENLLHIRPRKGEAKPQSEQEAYEAEAPAQKSAPSQAEEGKGSESSVPRRRRRLSDKTIQLNLKVNEQSFNRFTKIADDERLIYGDLFEKMLDKYEEE